MLRFAPEIRRKPIRPSAAARHVHGGKHASRGFAVFECTLRPRDRCRPSPAPLRSRGDDDRISQPGVKDLRMIACAAALAAISFPAGAAATNSAMVAPVSAITWTPYELKLRSGSSIPGELGTMQVPQVRSDQNSGTLGLRFVRLLDRQAGPDQAGGPGSSGVEAAQGACDWMPSTARMRPTLLHDPRRWAFRRHFVGISYGVPRLRRFATMAL